MAGPPPGADYDGVRVTDQYPRDEALIPVFPELHVSRSRRRLTSAMRNRIGASTWGGMTTRSESGSRPRLSGTFVAYWWGQLRVIARPGGPGLERGDPGTFT